MSDQVKRLVETRSWLEKLWPAQDEVKVEESKGNMMVEKMWPRMKQGQYEAKVEENKGNMKVEAVAGKGGKHCDVLFFLWYERMQCFIGGG